jgi:hypothetical protein
MKTKTHSVLEDLGQMIWIWMTIDDLALTSIFYDDRWFSTDLHFLKYFERGGLLLSMCFLFTLTSRSLSSSPQSRHLALLPVLTYESTSFQSSGILPPAPIWQCSETLVVVKARCAYTHLEGRGKDVAKHLIMQRKAPCNNIQAKISIALRMRRPVLENKLPLPFSLGTWAAQVSRDSTFVDMKGREPLKNTA